jgi:hypothetical protein
MSAYLFQLPLLRIYLPNNENYVYLIAKMLSCVKWN